MKCRDTLALELLLITVAIASTASQINHSAESHHSHGSSGDFTVIKTVAAMITVTVYFAMSHM